jgi:hypothetical protein
MHLSDETESSCSHFSQINTLLWAMLQHSFTGLQISSQRLENIWYCEDINKKPRCHCLTQMLASEIHCNAMLLRVMLTVFCLKISINTVFLQSGYQYSVLAVRLSIQCSCSPSINTVFLQSGYQYSVLAVWLSINMSTLGWLFTNYNLNSAGILVRNYGLQFMLLRNKTIKGNSVVLLSIYISKRAV